ncbi:hypothetical protein [Microcystis phage Mel-JY01]
MISIPVRMKIGLTVSPTCGRYSDEHFLLTDDGAYPVYSLDGHGTVHNVTVTIHSKNNLDIDYSMKDFQLDFVENYVPELLDTIEGSTTAIEKFVVDVYSRGVRKNTMV